MKSCTLILLADENALKNFDTSRSEADMLLDVDTDTDTDSDNQGGGEHQKNSKKVENTKKKKKTQQEQTLYDWMSKSPASTSAVQSPMRDERQEATDGDVVVGINDDEVMKDSGETPSSKLLILYLLIHPCLCLIKNRELKSTVQ